ncbi:MAG: DUF2807 domain-containing protein [Devosia nanyangense]|uniref:DUF2807 domain-containing protein n=1 Tax=Devosia nanyangense TaxID=1228055 RepID=A0A933NY31_9HYPH|nr:DUF2807 domain-containing protein [Devosia nanyangense]
MTARSLFVGALMGSAISTAALAESRTYEVPTFDQVSVSSGISATIEIGGAQSVIADAFNAAILERVQVDVRNGRLEVSLRWDALDWVFNFGADKGVVLHVAAPALKAAESSAGADVEVRGMSGDTLALSASSGSNIVATDVKGGRVDLSASSGAYLKLTGTCEHLVAAASSGANIEAGGLACQDVNANASVGGHVSVRAERSLDANASVGGSILVSGNPATTTIDSSTGGSVSFAP